MSNEDKDFLDGIERALTETAYATYDASTVSRLLDIARGAPARPDANLELGMRFLTKLSAALAEQEYAKARNARERLAADCAIAAFREAREAGDVSTERAERYAAFFKAFRAELDKDYSGPVQ